MFILCLCSVPSDSLVAVQDVDVLTVSLVHFQMISACARCFLAALVYLPRPTASLCLHSHIAAFGVFT